MGRSSAKKKTTLATEVPVVEAKVKKHQKTPVKEVVPETDSTTDNDSVVASKKPRMKEVKKKKTKQQKSAQPVVAKKPVPVEDSDDTSSSSSSASEKKVAKEPVKKVAVLTKVDKKQRVIPPVQQPVNDSTSSSDESTSEDDSDDDDVPMVNTLKTSTQQKSEIKNETTSSSSEGSSDDDTSSSEDEILKSAKDVTKATVESKLDIPKKSIVSSTDDSSSDENSDEGSDDSSSDDDDSDDDDNEDSTHEESTTENAVATNDSMEDVDATTSPTFESHVLQAWTTEITAEGPEWKPIYTSEADIKDIPTKYTIDIQSSELGELPLLKLIKEGEDSKHQDSELMVEKRKRARISLDQHEDKQPSKKFHLDTEGKQEVFVGNLPYGTGEEELRELFEESCGKIQKMKILGQGGAAFIEFDSKEAVDSALLWNRSDYNGRKLTINLASDKPQKNGQTFSRNNADTPPNATVIVRNIPYNTSPDDIKHFFMKIAEVQNVNLPTFQDTGKMRGFAVVHFASAPDAQKALQLSDTQLSGRTVSIEIARPREDQGGNRRGGGNAPQRRNFQNRKPARHANAQPIRNHRVFKDNDDDE